MEHAWQDGVVRMYVEYLFLFSIVSLYPSFTDRPFIPSIVIEVKSVLPRWNDGIPHGIFRIAKEFPEFRVQIGALFVEGYTGFPAQGYSLKANRKMAEGKQHPDRNGQFHHISNTAMVFQEQNEPVISVDAKNRELIGNFANKGKEWEPKGESTEVNTHDFPDKDLGKVSPYGIYDLKENEGWVSVGIDRNTAEFAVESIRTWWKKMGKQRYPKAKKLLITADAGGSNGYRIRLWKVELQKLANELGVPISVCHFPPGTSKWNKIEHRMFSYISKNWRGRPLISRAVVVELIGGTKTEAGLQIKAALDENTYEKGIKISDKEMKTLNIERDDFHGEWNYTIHPQIKP